MVTPFLKESCVELRKVSCFTRGLAEAVPGAGLAVAGRRGAS